MRKVFVFLFSKEFLYFFLIAAQVAAIVFLCVLLPAFLPLGVTLLAAWAVAVTTCGALLTSDRGNEYKLAWLAVFLALPLAAPLIFIAGSSYGKKKRELKIGSDTEFLFSEAAKKACGAGASGYEKCEYFRDGTEFFNALFDKIGRAKKYVLLEFYIIAKGRIFERFIKALKAAKENGAEIKIILDGLGPAFKIGRRQINQLKTLGEFKRFHKIVPLPISRHNMRDHRKIAVIDGEIAFTGGINIADEYANIDSNFGYWKDGAVSVTGSAAKAFEAMFYSVWQGKGEADVTKKENEKPCLAYCDSPPHSKFCEDAYVAAILSAKRRVHIMTPYFCGSDKLISALAFAGMSGVEVKIIVPHVPDRKYVHAVTKAFARELSRSGVEFYEFSPGFMHSKCLIFDDYAFLGSYNLDFRSLNLNYECGILFDGEIVDKVERDFSDCLTLSSPLVHGKATPISGFKRFFLKLFSPLI